MDTIWTPAKQTLQPYKTAQKQAYRAVQTIAEVLQPGMTTADTAHLVRDWLRYHEAFDEALPLPQAMFYDSGFDGNRAPRPRWTRLRKSARTARYQPHQTYRLRCHACVDGCAAAAELYGALAPQPAQTQLQHELLRYRRQLPQHLAEGTPPAALQAAWDQAHPGWRVTISARHRPLAGETARDKPAPNQPLATGLWQLRMTLRSGRAQTGLSELLVVDADGVYWLDNDLPHLRATQQDATATEAA